MPASSFHVSVLPFVHLTRMRRRPCVPGGWMLLRRNEFVRTTLLPLFIASGACAPSSDADGNTAVVSVAVAGNFAAPFEVLAKQFTEMSGVRVDVSVGSTGLFYAQIQNGAPFDVFLSADAARPERLESEGLTVAGSRFTYAVGRLAFYAPARDSTNWNV